MRHLPSHTASYLNIMYLNIIMLVVAGKLATLLGKPKATLGMKMTLVFLILNPLYRQKISLQCSLVKGWSEPVRVENLRRGQFIHITSRDGDNSQGSPPSIW